MATQHLLLRVAGDLLTLPIETHDPPFAIQHHHQRPRCVHHSIGKIALRPQPCLSLFVPSQIVNEPLQLCRCKVLSHQLIRRNVVDILIKLLPDHNDRVRMRHA